MHYGLGHTERFRRGMVSRRRIVFVLPLHARIPCGGVKVVFEYANRFVDNGWRVTIVMAAAVGWRKMGLVAKLRAIPYYFYCWLVRSNRYPKWFALDSRVICKTVPLPHYSFLPKSDSYVLCGPDSAQYFYSFPVGACVCYFIQHHDNWNMDDDSIFETYRLPMVKFVIAGWLKRLVASHGGDNIVDIPNGFDFSVFKVLTPIRERHEPVVSLMYHPLPLKGYEDAIKAVYEARNQIPNIKVLVFGAYEPPRNFPKWATYYKSPSGLPLAEIYNQSSVFISASHSEGWGLTVGEAMACGAAICCTSCEGHLEMVEPDVSGLTTEVGDINGLSANLIKLLSDDSLRIKIAESGVKRISHFTWEESFDQMRRALLKSL